ncbi:hypothetical protein SHI21_06595 [Bacteriovorax sp. PP10]|uniref:Uncharacterized protein n=1 Tax=Bacteriovorax antarcticus TaxID=3088717 RepID=A0ABU5VU23_9BACT|nr:hypothetical protein [Bacteriovorax sp. PP10]MEA9355859.1 hypothetical protein [Bacteriovorax sp. PP10]
MKFLAIVCSVMFSVQVFAVTPYTFHCTFSGDSCKISEVTKMDEIETGLFGGVEGNFELYYEKKSETMYIYLGDDLKGLSIGAHTMAQQNEAKNGLVGIILGEDSSTFKELSIARPVLK